MKYCIRTPMGLITITRGCPTLADKSAEASTWQTRGGAERALARARPVASRVVLVDADVVADIVASAWHDHQRQARYRVMFLRADILDGLRMRLTAAKWAGPGQTVHGKPWTHDEADAMLDAELDRIDQLCIDDPELAAGWLTSAQRRGLVGRPPKETT